MANKELLKKVLQHIKDHPEGWDQEDWTSCFGGWAVRLAYPGAEVVTRECGCGPECSATDRRLMDADGNRIDVPVVARGLLGLSQGSEAGGLFWGRNTLEDLERIVGELIAA